MKSCVAWYPVMLMLAIDFAFAITNVLLKKIIIDGMNHLVFITYRQSISTIFLAPVAFFVERYVGSVLLLIHFAQYFFQKCDTHNHYIIQISSLHQLL